MQIVIDIPEDAFEAIKKNGWSYYDIRESVKNGKPLPKGHGKIADLSAVYEDICNDLNEMTRIGVAVDWDWLWAKLNDAIDNAPIIIEGSEYK